jgi:hypothetical protein
MKFGTHEVSTEPDFSKLDSVDDIIRDAKKWDLYDDLRMRLHPECQAGSAQAAQVLRDVAYELAGENDKALAVDVFLHACGIAEFEATSLRDYGDVHGKSHEHFRLKVQAMRHRLGLPTTSSKTR